MKRHKRLDEATEKLVDLIDAHLAKLPTSERDAKWRDLHQGAARLGTPAKAGVQSKTLATRRVARRRA